MFIEEYLTTYDIYAGPYGSNPVMFSETSIELRTLSNKDFIGRGNSLRIYENRCADSKMIIRIIQLKSKRFQVEVYNNIVLTTDFYESALDKALSAFHKILKTN